MPKTSTTRTAKLHPGRDAGHTAGDSAPIPPSRAAREHSGRGDDAGRPPTPSLSISEHDEPQGPATAFSSEAQRQAVESGIHTLLDLGGAREDLAWAAQHRRDDIMTAEQRQRAVADLERIIGEMAGGLARAIRDGGVRVHVEGADRPRLPDHVLEDLGLRKPA